MRVEDTPSLITVQETQAHEVTAERADLFVTVEGASLFTGQEALKKAREVAQLAADLSAAGLPSDALFLQGVSADVLSGTLTKSSRARYRLRIRCTDLSKMGDYVGIITAQKNTSLTATEWGYPDDDAQRDAWLLACIARVNAKSAKIAAALGVRVLGVQSFTDSIADPEARYQEVGTLGHEPVRMRRKSMTSEDLGMEVSHTKTVLVTVEVQYLVSGFEAGQ